MKGVGDEQRTFAGGGELVGKNLVEAVRRVDRGGEETVPDHIVEERLRKGFFKSEDGIFLEDRGHGVSEGGGL